jgi:hypothetical protein
MAFPSNIPNHDQVVPETLENCKKRRTSEDESPIIRATKRSRKFVILDDSESENSCSESEYESEDDDSGKDSEGKDSGKDYSDDEAESSASTESEPSDAETLDEDESRSLDDEEEESDSFIVGDDVIY